MTQKKHLMTQTQQTNPLMKLQKMMLLKKLLNNSEQKFNLYTISGKGIYVSLAFRVSTGGNYKCKL